MIDPVWYALRVTSGYDISKRRAMELTVAEELRDDGYTVMLPVQRVVRHDRSNRGRTIKRERLRPLIPCYAFCTEVPEHKRVRGVLKLGDRPYPIPHRQFAGLLAMQDESRDEGDVPATLSIGQVIRLTGGSFEGLPITVATLDGAETITGDVSLFGKVHRVKIERDKIAA
jgi:transcription antitermination factor NusG